MTAPDTKPERMEVNPGKLPKELRAGKAFVVWDWEWKPDKEKWDKPPKCQGNGDYANTRDPATWSDFNSALKAHQDGTFDGIGIVPTGKLVGIDLDKCLNPVTLGLEPQAEAIVARLNSYTEITPSAEGVRVWIHGKIPSGAGRRKGSIEIYDGTTKAGKPGGRYFTLTGNHLEPTPKTVEHRQSQLESLVKELWPSKKEPRARSGKGPASGPILSNEADILKKAMGANDGGKFMRLWNGDISGYESASEADLALCMKLAFWTRRDPEAIESLFRQSGLYRDKWDREDYRMGTIDKAVASTTEVYQPPATDGQPPATDDDDDIPSYVRQLNKRHAVVMLGGKTVVMNETYDHQFQRPDITFSTINDLNHWYANEIVFIGEKAHTKARLWLASQHRRQYEQIVFEPDGAPPTIYNMWRGFSVEPVKGSWELYKQHLWENVCSEKEDLFDYLEDWMADIVQNPGGERPGVSIALRGAPGVGKGVAACQFGALFGPHFLHISSPRQLTGRFNSHLKDTLIVFCDEAIWGGSKEAEGTLKAMITEDVILVEPKGKDVFPIKNRVRLIVASNNDWIVPATLGDRRFLVIDVGEGRRRDSRYFGALINQMREGGREAMLHDLLDHKITTDLRRIPDTDAKVEQMQRSMNPVEKFWFECLIDGSIGSDSSGWPTTVGTKLIYEEYLEFAHSIGQKYLLTPSSFVRELKKLAPPNFYKTRKGTSDRTYTYVLPPLDRCREHFIHKMGCEVAW